jgi:hypothetical protein
MLQVAFRVLSRYAPIITLHVAVILRFVGYSIESRISNRKTPYMDHSINEEREKRILNETAEEKEAVASGSSPYASIFDRNDAQQLKKK